MMTRAAAQVGDALYKREVARLSGDKWDDHDWVR